MTTLPSFDVKGGEILRTIRLGLWLLLELAILLPICLTFSATGIQNVFPDAGMKLSKIMIPGYSLLDEFEWSHRLTIAHCFATVMLLFTRVSYGLLIRLWVTGTVPLMKLLPEANPDVVWKLTCFPAIGFIVVDAYFMYAGLAMSTWGQSALSFTAIIGAIAYTLVIVMCSFMEFYLSLSRKEKEE